MEKGYFWVGVLQRNSVICKLFIFCLSKCAFYVCAKNVECYYILLMFSYLFAYKAYNNHHQHHHHHPCWRHDTSKNCKNCFVNLNKIYIKILLCKNLSLCEYLCVMWCLRWEEEEKYNNTLWVFTKEHLVRITFSLG